MNSFILSAARLLSTFAPNVQVFGCPPLLAGQFSSSSSRPHLVLAALLGRLYYLGGTLVAATHAMIRYPVLVSQNGQKVGVELQVGPPRTPSLSHSMQLINRPCTGHRDAKTMVKHGKHPIAMRLGCGQGNSASSKDAASNLTRPSPGIGG
jgi:hypothetical protein